MINEGLRLRVVTMDKQECYAEVNWNTHVKDYIRLTINGQSTVIPTSEFTQIALMAASEDDQERLVPSTIMRRRTFRKVQTIKLAKDMPRNSILTIPAEFSVDLPDNVDPKFT